MPTYIQSSLDQLATCHKDLQTIFSTVILFFDCKVIEGFRNEEAQNKDYASGRSKLKWPNGNHNKNPSMAVDVMPCPIDWNDRERMSYFAGWVMGIARMLKAQGLITHNLKWGGDWNSDTEVRDNNFDDLSHFELIP